MIKLYQVSRSTTMIKLRTPMIIPTIADTIRLFHGYVYFDIMPPFMERSYHAYLQQPSCDHVRGTHSVWQIDWSCQNQPMAD